MRHRLMAAVALAIAVSASLARAQTSVERFERQLQQIQQDTRLRINPDVPAEQRALLDYGGYFTFNFFAIDDIEQNTHLLRQYDLVGYARLNIDNVHEFFLRARTSYRDFNNNQSFDGEGDEMIWPTVEQAYYRFDLARYLSAYKNKVIKNNLTVQVGRQFVNWANGLVLAEYVDGGLAEVTVGNISLQLLAGVTTHDTVDIDSSRPQFDDRTERGFYGGILSAQLGKHRPFVYGLVQRDWNDDVPLVVGSNTTNFDYDSWYIGTGVNGSIGDQMLYGVEFAYEGGKTLSNTFEPNTLAPIPQERDQIQAGALDARLDYLFTDVRRSRLSFETIAASGDLDRIHTTNTFGGNAPGSRDHAFNAWGLLNTGLAFAPNVSNLISVRVGGSMFPFPSSTVLKRFQAGTDVLGFFKFRADAPIDETTSDDRYLGWEPDVYINWQMSSDVTLALRYGVFFPGSAIESDEHPRNFFYLGVTFAF
ncbi:MAG TPA: alginate export family protein [Tepidisphaeraceae bacterium]|nr:alginate export family protein [Tepidisphaeraceae bacterium]